MSLSAADRARERRLQHEYGIGLDDYEAVLEAQGGGCAICGRKRGLVRLSLDHDHRIGDGHPYAVRGILCWLCNKAIAGIREDPDLALRVAAYLVDPPARVVLRRRYPDAAAVKPRPHKRKQRRRISREIAPGNT